MKKLLNILSVLTFASLTSLSTIACQQQNNMSFSLQQKEKYVVMAINAEQNRHLKTNFNQLTISDILENPKIILNYKHGISFTYDIKIKQNANTFWNNNFVYRIPEVSGDFTLNLDNNNIIDNHITKITYLVGNYQNYINNVANILTGSTNDFTLIMNAPNWTNFVNWISNDTNWNGHDGGNAWLYNLNINNSNIILTNDQWNSILHHLNILGILRIDDGYAACIHIVREPGKDFQVSYNNLTKQEEHNMPLEIKVPWLPLFAFKSPNDDDRMSIDQNNKFICLNKDILKEFNDIYSDNSQDYKYNNWNVSTISNLLSINHLCNTNLDFRSIATCLINNWNSKLINHFLTSDHEYFLMQYDANNNYVKNNWNM